MPQPVQKRIQEPQSRKARLENWLRRNIAPVGVMLAMVVIGVYTLTTATVRRHQREEAQKAVMPKWTNKDWLESRYGHVDCARNPNCRQLKRIYAEGGASEEAIRKNILAADKSVTFERLEEDASLYEGLPWAFEGKIIDILFEDHRGIGDNVIAEISVGEDPGKLVDVVGDFTTDFDEGDYVYVVGYVTGTSHPRLGPSGLKYSNKVPGVSARALLKPGEARELIKGLASDR